MSDGVGILVLIIEFECIGEVGTVLLSESKRHC
jgi:hypothetical protein